jgi:hypothetical protein
MSRASEHLRKLADRYQLEDGTPGDLSACWGWRDMAMYLREAADEADEEENEEAARLRDALGVFANPVHWATADEMVSVDPGMFVWLLDRSYPVPAEFAQSVLEIKP